MENQKEADVQLMLETWSASYSDNGAIWEAWNKKLTEAKKAWSADYAKEVHAEATARWPKV